MRPLSIYCYEDKLVQEALRRILEAVFEPMFYDEIMGFRPNRGCHKAIRKLNIMLERKPTNYVLDADIKGFYQHLDHEWIVRFIESRIKDPNIIRLVRRMLKAGIMNNYEFEATEEGSGQGSVCSPIISCIYMHYVLIWWFKEVVTPMLKGYAGLVVYADDFVVTFQYKSDAVWFYEHLKHRMGHFGLSLEEEKSRLIEFGRYAKERCSKSGTKPGTFTFLGFTHYCSKSKNGRFRVKRKTSKKKFAKKCREINQLMGHMKTWKLKEITAKLNQILTGYYHYYGITDNTERIIKLLGTPKYQKLTINEDEYGVVSTLAVASIGGIVSKLEVSLNKGSEKITITGNTGEILKESILVCLTMLKNKYKYNFHNQDIHLHFLDASTKKDGSSGGLPIAVAICSRFEEKKIPEDIAFTGEITLNGSILKIGGLKEKLIAAYNKNIKVVYIPASNMDDLKNIPKIILEQLEIIPVSNFSEVYTKLFK